MELNRQYILPAGYERNNLILVDWNGNSFILFYRKQGAKLFKLRIGQTVIFYVCGQHGSNIPAVKAFQKRTAFLAHILPFQYKRGVDEYPALFLIREGAFRHQTFDQGLYGFGAPDGGFQ